MGAVSRSLVFNFCADPAELSKRWKKAQREDLWKRGHGPYQGSIGELDLSIAARHFDTLSQAQAYAQSELDMLDKRRAIAVRFGAKARIFPATERDRQLVAAHKALSEENVLFEREILLRFVRSKSASKRCGHCESVISKKSRERLAREPYRATLDKLSSYLDRREYIASQTNCPACGNNLLITETDQKRKKSLEARLQAASQKLEAAEAAFKAKAEDYGYYVVGWAPE